MARFDVGAKVRVCDKDGDVVLAEVEGQTAPDEPLILPDGRKRDGYIVRFLEGDSSGLGGTYLPEDMEAAV